MTCFPMEMDDMLRGYIGREYGFVLGLDTGASASSCARA